MEVGILYLAFLLAFYQPFACWIPYQATGYLAFG